MRLLLLFLFLSTTLSVSISAAESEQSSASKLLDKPLAAVVGVSVEEIKTNSASSAFEKIGSGMIIQSDGLVLTDAELVEHPGSIKVVLPGGRIYAARLVGKDRTTGLALLKIDANDLVTVALGKSKGTALSEEVWALGGNPESATGTPHITGGVVVNPGSTTEKPPFVQSTVALLPGMAGGPLLRAKTGEVIGVNKFILRSRTAGTIAFSVPTETFDKVKDDLLSKGYVRYGTIVVSIVPVSEELATLLRVAPGSAMIKKLINVDSEAPNTLAIGDVVLEFDAKPIKSPEDLIYAIREAEPGTTKVVKVSRRGETLKLEVRVAAHPR